MCTNNLFKTCLSAVYTASRSYRGFISVSYFDSPAGIKDCVKMMTEQQMRQQQQKFRSAWVARAVIVA